MHITHRKLLALASLISATSLSHGAGCCQGVGAAGLDGDWEPAKGPQGPRTVAFSHASFETSRDVFAELNADFTNRWARKTGFKLTVNESHASSEAQVRSILFGSDPDIVSLDTPAAIDALASSKKLLPETWQQRLPHSSIPYTTTIVFVVDKGNPKHVHGWSDLSREGVSVLTPNPKTSARGRWNYFAAWSQALRTNAGDAEKAREQLTKLYANVPVLNSNARGAQDSFVLKGKGDVLVVWESDARQLLGQDTARKLEIVTPPSSLLVELPVAYLDENLRKHEVTRIAISFAKYLFTEDAQEIIARHHYRPVDKGVLAKVSKSFPSLELLSIAGEFGSWAKAEESHFAPGGTFDRVIGNAPASTTASLGAGASHNSH